MRRKIGGHADNFIRMAAVGAHCNDICQARLGEQTVHAFPSLPSPAGVADLENDGPSRRGSGGQSGFGFARLHKRLQKQRIGFDKRQTLSPINLLQRPVRIVLQAKPQPQRPDRGPDQALCAARLSGQGDSRAVYVVA